MDLPALLLLALVGALIGAVGIGGFLVVPVLVFVQGRPLREAVIAAVVAFVGAGVVSLAVVLRQPQNTGISRPCVGVVAAARFQAETAA